MFPFDIRHRSVITYATDAPSSFSKLSSQITVKIQAELRSDRSIRDIASAEQLAPISGLSKNELIVVAALAGHTDAADESVSIYAVRQDAERNGLTKVGFAVACQQLTAKSLIEVVQVHDYRGEPFYALRLTESGWKWTIANQHAFILHRDGKQDSSSYEITDDDIPF